MQECERERGGAGASVSRVFLKEKEGGDGSVEHRPKGNGLGWSDPYVERPPSLGLVHVITINAIIMSMSLIFVNAMLLFSYYVHVTNIC